MGWLANEYVKAGFPSHEVWNFTPADGDLGAAELRALGLLYFGGPHGGPWQLTAKGVAWIMANRASLRMATAAGTPSKMSAPTNYLSIERDPTTPGAASPSSLASVPPMTDLEAEAHITNGLAALVDGNFPAKPMQVYPKKDLAARLGVPDEKLRMLEPIMAKNAHWGLTAKREQETIVLVFGPQGVREVAGNDDY
jgi:hypothetical protein